MLVAIEDREVRLQDTDGEPVDERPDIVAALADSARADSVIVDGYLTKETAREAVGVDPGLVETPSMGKFMTQSFFGSRRNRAQEVADRVEQVRMATSIDEEDEVGFVAVDLLWVDGEALLDVPLLERKRLLETVIAESDLVRVGVFVRQPIDTWVSSWRALGFVGLSFRAANSRYFPGEKQKDWTTTWMPRR